MAVGSAHCLRGRPWSWRVSMFELSMFRPRVISTVRQQAAEFLSTKHQHNKHAPAAVLCRIIWHSTSTERGRERERGCAATATATYLSVGTIDRTTTSRCVGTRVSKLHLSSQCPRLWAFALDTKPYVTLCFPFLSLHLSGARKSVCLLQYLSPFSSPWCGARRSRCG